MGISMHTIVDNHITLKIREWFRNEMCILARIYFAKNLNGSRFVLILEMLILLEVLL